MRYVDGFVLVVPKNKIKAYVTLAKDASKVWMKFGALEYKECVADDMAPKDVIFTFPIMAKAKKSETVVFSFIIYKSRKHRDSVNKKVMSDPAMNDPAMMKNMPFDVKRMVYGGFKAIVQA